MTPGDLRRLAVTQVPLKRLFEKLERNDNIDFGRGKKEKKVF